MGNDLNKLEEKGMPQLNLWCGDALNKLTEKERPKQTKMKGMP